MVTALKGLRRDLFALNQVVSGDKLTEVRQVNVNNALAGKVSGIQFRASLLLHLDVPVRSGYAVPVDSQTGTSVLYVVDGTILPNSNDLNMDDIEDISVLSGPAASAILGSQGANGAIIITTKKAKISGGKSMGVEVNTGVMASSVYILPNYQNDYAGGNVSGYVQIHLQSQALTLLNGSHLMVNIILIIPTMPAGDPGWPDRNIFHGIHGIPGSKYTGTTAQTYSSAFELQGIFTIQA